MYLSHDHDLGDMHQRVRRMQAEALRAGVARLGNWLRATFVRSGVVARQGA